MLKSISQTPATVVIYCGNQVLSAPRGGFAPRIELAFGDSASLRGIRGKAGASEMRPYQDGAYPPAEGSPKGRLRGVRMWRGQG